MKNGSQEAVSQEASATGESGTTLRVLREAYTSTRGGPYWVDAFQEARLRSVMFELREQAAAESSDIQAQALKSWTHDE